MPKTLYDKLWDSHEVAQREDGSFLLYIDRHLIHEVTSPQAFEGLKMAGREPWRVSSNIATPDHNVPTTNREKGIEGIEDEIAILRLINIRDGVSDKPEEVEILKSLETQIKSTLSQDLFRIMVSDVQKSRGITVDESAINAVHVNFQ